MTKIETLRKEREELLARIAEIDREIEMLTTTTTNNNKRAVVIYTDGSCSGNPGPGGWAAVLECAGTQKTISGGEDSTTNNRMELTAVIEALAALKASCNVTLRADSAYVCNAIEKGWLENWQKRNWVKSDKKPVENKDLWEALIPLLSRHAVTIEKVAGHAGNPGNELADKLATAETAKRK